MKDITVKLSKPLMDQDGKEHKELVLTEPTGRQWDAIGNPIKMSMSDGEQFVVVDNKKLTQYVSEVTGVHEASIYKLPFSELQKVQNEMMTFFGQADTAS